MSGRVSEGRPGLAGPVPEPHPGGMSDDDLDLLVPDDQGPSTEAAGVVHPDGHVTREADHLAEDEPTQDGLAQGIDG